MIELVTFLKLVLVYFFSLYTGWSFKTSFIQGRASSSSPSLLRASWMADLMSDRTASLMSLNFGE